MIPTFWHIYLKRNFSSAYWRVHSTKFFGTVRQKLFDKKLWYILDAITCESHRSSKRSPLRNFPQIFTKIYERHTSFKRYPTKFYTLSRKFFSTVRQKFSDKNLDWKIPFWYIDLTSKTQFFKHTGGSPYKIFGTVRRIFRQKSWYLSKISFLAYISETQFFFSTLNFFGTEFAIIKYTQIESPNHFCHVF